MDKDVQGVGSMFVSVTANYKLLIPIWRIPDITDYLLPIIDETCYSDIMR